MRQEGGGGEKPKKPTKNNDNFPDTSASHDAIATQCCLPCNAATNPRPKGENKTKNMPMLEHSAAGVQPSIGLKGYANQYKVVLGTSAIILMSS